MSFRSGRGEPRMCERRNVRSTAPLCRARNAALDHSRNQQLPTSNCQQRHLRLTHRWNRRRGESTSLRGPQCLSGVPDDVEPEETPIRATNAESDLVTGVRRPCRWRPEGTGVSRAGLTDDDINGPQGRPAERYRVRTGVATGTAVDSPRSRTRPSAVAAII